jgi:hypothetical protein
LAVTCYKIYFNAVEKYIMDMVSRKSSLVLMPSQQFLDLEIFF